MIGLVGCQKETPENSSRAENSSVVSSNEDIKTETENPANASDSEPPVEASYHLYTDGMDAWMDVTIEKCEKALSAALIEEGIPDGLEFKNKRGDLYTYDFGSVKGYFSGQFLIGVIEHEGEEYVSKFTIGMQSETEEQAEDSGIMVKVLLEYCNPGLWEETADTLHIFGPNRAEFFKDTYSYPDCAYDAVIYNYTDPLTLRVDFDQSQAEAVKKENMIVKPQ